VKRSNVPPERIGSGNRWINWTAEKQPRGRLRKVPYSPVTRRAIDVTKDGNGSTYQVAAKWKPNRLGLLVFPPLIAIDLDLAISEKTGEVEEWAMEIVDRIDSYTEVSPSGLGLHILAMGIIETDGNRVGQIEMYSNKRFITFTGNHLQGTPNRVEKRFAEVKAFWSATFGGRPAGSNVQPPRSAFGRGQADEQVLATALEQSDQFARLYEGDHSHYKSRSEADLAFCSLLTKFTSDPDQIDSIFRSSRLMRSKWDDRDSYRHQTLAKAFQKTQILGSSTTSSSTSSLTSCSFRSWQIGN
jgi:primase-polymerase (primpol)-like protein